MHNKRRESFICDVYSLVPWHTAVTQEQVNIDFFASGNSHTGA